MLIPFVVEGRNRVENERERERERKKEREKENFRVLLVDGTDCVRT